jgi:hypothetical protein
MASESGDAFNEVDLATLSIDQVKVEAGSQVSPDSSKPADEVERVLQDSPRIEYQDKFVAFIDLLGFRQIVMRTSRHAGRADDNGFRKDTLGQIHGALSSVPEDDYRDLFRARYLGSNDIESLRLGVAGFSDTLIFWSDPTCEAFGLLVHAIFQTVREFTLRGFYCRGGVKLGELLIDSSEICGKRRSMPVMFGPAFIQAYDLEQRHAQDARIIFCNDSTKALKSYRDDAANRYPLLAKFFDDYLFQATDGPWQIDIFADIRRPDESAAEAVENSAKTIADKLTAIMAEYTESPAVYRKLLAVAKTFNKALEEGSTKIPGLMHHILPLPSARH